MRERECDALGFHEVRPELGELGAQRLQACDESFVVGQEVSRQNPAAHVESREGARWLVTTACGDFERFVRQLSRPAEADCLPDPSGPPTPEQQHALATAAAANGIELLGPPLA